MEKTLSLKDGTQVLIRPMQPNDVDRSLIFFQALPEEDRKYLRRDVTQREVIKERIKALQTGEVKRLVAVLNDEIIGDGSLELESYGWKSHISEIRLIVARPFQRQGLGRLLAHELFWLAAAEKVEQVVMKVMSPQVAALKIAERLGFAEDSTLSEYVKDQSGSRQDLIIMRCDLQALMREMEDVLTDSDFQRSR